MPVVDIRTEGACHLDAAMIDRAIERLPLDDIDLLFIENVGNLVCPASYDLGESMKITVISTTEGDDKPEKYPSMFARSGVMVINKIDLLPYTDFDVDTARDHALQLNPKLETFALSCRSGEGIEQWFEFLDVKLKRLKGN
jgi:hydrogenase nickel incorporation protein HypB